MKKEPTKEEATKLLYEIIINHFEHACRSQDVVPINNYIPQDTDTGTLSVAIQPRAALLFVDQNSEQIELCLSDFLIYCDELNNRYETFGFNQLTIA